MPIDIKVPEVGESIREVEIGGWLKAKGETIRKDEPVVSLESEKATIEIASPSAGVLTNILKKKGEVAKVGEVIAQMESGPGTAPSAKVADPELKAGPTAPAASQPAQESRVMPAAQRILTEQGLRPEGIPATGPGGRLLKEDVLRNLQQGAPASSAAVPEPTPLPAAVSQSTAAREEEVVPMSKLRRTLAERLVQVQQTAAMLTTFNEIDMFSVMELRKQYGEAFLEKHKVKLGFMSFFVKACVEALKQFPAINAEVRGTNIVYRNYFDLGVAIGGGKGLVVPVLRNAERLSFSEIEVAVGDFGRRAKESKLKPEELQGGTFTLTNGGVYGSLLSTPILNPPQSGILGMHSIQDRPVARDGAVVIRPMMYVALTYDHRIVDGREAVTFLKRIKEIIEAPARMLLEV
ncbi:MAG TPA: 2-oxoglutarate dehydrogenase complex dihydrolipoyllysine-residue succinyltransferase [Candidatus Saccharimonadales bacterium]|nr:2-oxoglutarate dehydrogenase complex dihydrolipoyllysine-residue succinyltransferase [Candidatus Saccharimonadales bacterium]